MIKNYKGREIDLLSPVEVYRNLNNGKLSIKQNGLVVGHCDNLLLKNVTTKVSEKGRQRVLKSKTKNVHAHLLGIIVPTETFDQNKQDELDRELYYNPYLTKDFTDKETKSEMTGIKLSLVYITSDGVMRYCL